MSNNNDSILSNDTSNDDEKTTFDGDKDKDFCSWYEQICRFADVVDKRYPIKGMPVWKPYGYFMHNQIMNLVENHWDQQGIEKSQFPLLIPVTFLEKEKDHVKGFEDECFWVTKGGSKDLDVKLALRPTSETAMYYMFALWIRSFRDLPLKLHQTCNVFRHETKDTRPLIRIREIFWNEAHTCHATKEEALENLELAWKAYMDVIENGCCFTGLRLRRPEWDKFAGAEHTDVLDAIMPDGKVLQAVGAHYLGQKFAKVFDIKFLDEKNKFQFAEMTCYGVSTRLLAACLSAHGDNKGLVLPPAIAKYQLVFVPIVMKKSDNSTEEACFELQKQLQSQGIRSFVDNSKKKPGEKYYYWEMKGVPLRVEIGPRDLEKGQITIVARDNGEKVSIEKVNAIEGIREQLKLLNHRLLEKATKFHNDHVVECLTREQLQETIKKGGFAKIPFVSYGIDGKEADKIIHELTGGEVRGWRPTDQPPAAGTLCLATGKPATVWGYVARSY